jgi:hypothetical protein
LMRAALKEFNTTDKLDERHAASVSVRFAHREIGQGIDRIEAKLFQGSEAKKSAQKKKLAETLRLPELDFVARVLAGEEAEKLADELYALLTDPGQLPKEIGAFILKKKEEVEK